MFKVEFGKSVKVLATSSVSNEREKAKVRSNFQSDFYIRPVSKRKEKRGRERERERERDR